MSKEKIGQQGMQTKIQKLNTTRFKATYTKINAPMILKIALATSDTSQDTPYSSSLAETGPSGRVALVSSARHLLPVRDCLAERGQTGSFSYSENLQSLWAQRALANKYQKPSVCPQFPPFPVPNFPSLERNTSREPAHLTSSRAMVIKPITRRGDQQESMLLRQSRRSRRFRSNSYDCGDPKEPTEPTRVAQNSRSSLSAGERREVPFD